MSETPLFKFKKTTSRRIGDFDVFDRSLRTLLIKPQIQDVTLFMHFEKLWNVEETADELDSDGNVVTKGVKSSPAWRQLQGFIKDDKFVVTSNRLITANNYHTIHTKYIQELKWCLDKGYIKDIRNYIGEIPIEPKYYVNEKTSLDEMQAISSKMGELAQQKMQGAMSSIPQPSVTPKAHKLGGIFSNILRKKDETNP